MPISPLTSCEEYFASVFSVRNPYSTLKIGEAYFSVGIYLPLCTSTHLRRRIDRPVIICRINSGQLSKLLGVKRELYFENETVGVEYQGFILS